MARIKTIDVIALALQIDGHILTSSGRRHQDFCRDHQLPMLQWPTRLGEIPQEKTINHVLTQVEEDYRIRLFAPHLSWDYFVLQGKLLKGIPCSIRVRLLTAHIDSSRSISYSPCNKPETLHTAKKDYHFSFFINGMGQLPLWESIICNQVDIIRRVKL